MTDTVSIEARGLAVSKSGAQILKGQDFAVRPGTLVGLVGPSGSGKTTLMRTIVGVQKIHAGKLRVLDCPAGAKALRPRIGYVAQTPAIYTDLTVWQNLKYFGSLARAPRGQLRDILMKVRLDDRKNQLVETLSGGQKARVSLAVALLGDPDVLVLDEPTVGLDPLLRQELWQLFAELAANGKTLIVSSHVMDEAEKCDELLLLRDGELLWRDSRTKLLAETGKTSVEAAFLAVVQTKEAA